MPPLPVLFGLRREDVRDELETGLADLAGKCVQAGVGYLNDWDIAAKERDVPPTAKAGGTEYVNEAPAKKAL